MKDNIAYIVYIKIKDEETKGDGGKSVICHFVHRVFKCRCSNCSFLLLG